MAGNANGPHRGEGTWTKPGFLAAAALVAFIAVLAVVLLSTKGPESDPGAGASPGAAAPQGAHQDAAAGSACDLPAGDQAVPVTTPTDTHWTLVGTMAAPTDPKTYGPGARSHGLRTCFAHSPTGALYATVNFWAAATTGVPASKGYEVLAAPSEAQRTAIRNSRASSSGALEGFQVAGFSFSSYSPERADVKLAFRLSNGTIASIGSTMLWHEGDWRYEVPLDQHPLIAQGDDVDLSSFVAWKGV